MMVIMHYTVVGFVTSPMADALVNMMPVPVDKVPFLVIAVLPIGEVHHGARVRENDTFISQSTSVPT